MTWMSRVGANRQDVGFCTGRRHNIDREYIVISYIVFSEVLPYIRVYGNT